VAAGVNAPYGFDEFDAFELLYQCVSAAPENPIQIAIKFHPYENSEQFQQKAESLPAAPHISLQFLTGKENSHKWAQWADLAVGISSILLLEAMIFSKPVISLQPRLVRENTFPAGQYGCAPTLTDPGEAKELILELIQQPDKRQQLKQMHRPFVESIPTDTVSPVANWIQTQSNKPVHGV